LHKPEPGKPGYLVLARHGNTFEPGQQVVWVGSRNDLPLSARGLSQANELGEVCRANAIIFDGILSGPLKRTREYAEIVREATNHGDQVKVDERLNEIDYGSWSGLSNEDVIRKFGAADLEAWNRFGRWPEHSDWGQSAEQIMREIEEFCAALAPKLALGLNFLAVTSNGRLKFFLNMIPEAFASAQKRKELTVKTGNISLFSLEPGTKEFRSLAWNLPPQIAFNSLVSVL
jgi:broad specificity phosphatase PhoE